MAFGYRQEGHFILVRRPYSVWCCLVMGAFSVFTGAVYLFVSPFLSQRPPHPETDTVGASPFLCITSVEYRAWFRRKTLNRATGARNKTHENTENTGAGQAETASGVCPTKLSILKGSSRLKTTKLPYFRSQFFFCFLTSNCHIDSMITTPQPVSSWSWRWILKIFFWDRQTAFIEAKHDKSSFGRLN